MGEEGRVEKSEVRQPIGSRVHTDGQKTEDTGEREGRRDDDGRLGEAIIRLDRVLTHMIASRESKGEREGAGGACGSSNFGWRSTSHPLWAT